MALGSRDMASEKVKDSAVTVEELPAAETRGSRRSCCPLGRVLTLLTLAACCLCLGFVELHRLRQGAELQKQLVQLQMRLERLEGGDADDAALPDVDGDDPSAFRSRRSVSDSLLRTVDGVPIIDGPYGSRRRPASQGLRIYQTFQSQRETQPTAASVNYQVDDPSIQPHHRSSASHQTAARFGRVNTNTVIAGDERAPAGAASAPTARRAAAPGELHRRSRVSQSGQDGAAEGRGSASELTRAAAGRRAAAGGRRVNDIGDRQAAPMLEARGSPTSFVPPSSGGSGRAGHHGQKQQQQQQRGCAAAHYEGHVAASRKTSHYGGSEGNGHLRNTHPDSLFADWQPAAWMESQRCEEHFRLYSGQVTVATAGLYYLYAQINYLEDSDINGFEIQVNAETLVKCITMESSDLEEKINTCHTGAVTYLGPGDAVSIRDLEPNRHSILLPDRSFFGLVRLS